MALMREPNETVFQKTLALSDFYFGADDWEYPLGLIQMCATSHGEQIKGEALPRWLSVPAGYAVRKNGAPLDRFLAVLGRPAATENQIRYDGDRVVLDVTQQGQEAHQRLRKKLEGVVNVTAVRRLVGHMLSFK